MLTEIILTFIVFVTFALTALLIWGFITDVLFSRLAKLIRLDHSFSLVARNRAKVISLLTSLLIIAFHISYSGNRDSFGPIAVIITALPLYTVSYLISFTIDYRRLKNGLELPESLQSNLLIIFLLTLFNLFIAPQVVWRLIYFFVL
jgi:hypothetical protein